MRWTQTTTTTAATLDTDIEVWQATWLGPGVQRDAFEEFVED